MPPKKKGRSQATRGTPSNDEGEKSSAPDSAASADDTEIQQTPQVAQSARKWTDEEESALLRCVIKWKPVGMHKHFRMIAIVEALQASGAVEVTAPPLEAHHIWEKLGELYDLETLDEREDDLEWSPQEDAIDEPFCDFDLPDAEYDERKFKRRLAAEPPSSPPILSHQLAQRVEGSLEANRRYSTIEDSEDPRSSPASVSNRGGRRGRPARGRRGSHLASSARTGRNARGLKASADASMEEEEEAVDDDAMDVDKDPTPKKRRPSKDAEDASSRRRSGRHK